MHLPHKLYFILFLSLEDQKLYNLPLLYTKNVHDKIHDITALIIKGRAEPEYIIYDTDFYLEYILRT